MPPTSRTLPGRSRSSSRSCCPRPGRATRGASTSTLITCPRPACSTPSTMARRAPRRSSSRASPPTPRRGPAPPRSRCRSSSCSPLSRSLALHSSLTPPPHLLRVLLSPPAAPPEHPALQLRLRPRVGRLGLGARRPHEPFPPVRLPAWVLHTHFSSPQPLLPSLPLGVRSAFM